MKRRQIQRSQRLRAGLPAIALECNAAPRLLWLCTVPAALVVCALLFAPAPQLYWRLLFAGFVTVTTIPAVRLVAGSRVPNRVRALLWDAEGRWWLTDDDGVCVEARLTGARIFGALVFLKWKDAGRQLRRAAIDASAGPAAQGRALIGRIRLSQGSGTHQAC